jgi:23S rRNA (guanosine2251-2'-O)-methyltransferase
MLPKNIVTIYGRNAVLEALKEKELRVYALHLSKSNKSSDKLNLIIQSAKKRDIEIKYHTKERLSFISKNKKQDQGVALDIILDNLKDISYLKELESFRVLALDSIVNPQNLGMIIRSAAAGNIDAVIVSKKGSASIVSPLTIKASVGTLFKIPIIQTNSMVKSLKELALDNVELISLDLGAKSSLFNLKCGKKSIFILGNESRGVSKEISQISTKSVKIEMNRGVESLNVAITASLISFL